MSKRGNTRLQTNTQTGTEVSKNMSDTGSTASSLSHTRANDTTELLKHVKHYIIAWHNIDKVLNKRCMLYFGHQGGIVQRCQ